MPTTEPQPSENVTLPCWLAAGGSPTRNDGGGELAGSSSPSGRAAFLRLVDELHEDVLRHIDSLYGPETAA